VSKTEQRLVVACEALDQLRVKRRALCGCEGKLAGIDRNENGIAALFGVGSAIGSSRADRQRPGRNFVARRSTSDSTIEPHRWRQVEPDQVLSGGRTEMCAVSEPYVKD
jgi:hypothetical protein